MTNKEIKRKVAELLSSGVDKSEVYARLSGQGVKDRHLAHFITSYADTRLCEAHDGKINALITLMFIQAGIAILVSLSTGPKMSPLATWFAAGFMAMFPLLFALGFYKNWVGAYNAYIILSILQLPRQLGEFGSRPVASSIAIFIGIGMLAFMWYVRSKIFPDFAFFSPLKTNGRYVFSSRFNRHSSQ